MINADEVTVASVETADEALAWALGSQPAPSGDAIEVAIELLVHAGLDPLDLDARDVEVEDVVQTLVAQALDRCPPLLDAVEALLRARTTT